MDPLIEHFGGSGWVKRNTLWDWMRERGCVEGEKLAENNFSDGQYHCRWTHASGDTFELNANWYSAQTFAPLIEWALAVEAKHL